MKEKQIKIGELLSRLEKVPLVKFDVILPVSQKKIRVETLNDNIGDNPAYIVFSDKNGNFIGNVCGDKLCCNSIQSRQQCECILVFLETDNAKRQIDAYYDSKCYEVRMNANEKCNTLMEEKCKITGNKLIS